MCRCCCEEHVGHGHHEAHRSHHSEAEHHRGHSASLKGHGQSGFERRYFSNQEITADLKQYKEGLQKELAGVTERIAELEK